MLEALSDGSIASSKLLARLKKAAENGPPTSKEQYHQINKKRGAWEFKTHELRLFCFQDDRRFVCTHVLPKNQLTNREYPAQERRVLDIREDYMRDKADDRLSID